MAIKKVELLTVDANQDTLYPKTESDVVIHGNSTVSIVLDGKVDKTQVTTNATPSTIVERTIDANINIGNGVFFNDVQASRYLGGIGIGDGNTNGTPFADQPVHTKPNNTKVQIWTSETASINVESTVDTVVKRDTDRSIKGHAFRTTTNASEDVNGAYYSDEATNLATYYDYKVKPGHADANQWTTDIGTPYHIICDRKSQVDVIPVQSTIVKRNTSGNVNTFNSINMHDITVSTTDIDASYIGSITMDKDTRNLFHAHIPQGQFGNAHATNYQIHTQRDFPVEIGRWTPVIQSKTTNVKFTMEKNGTFGRYYRVGRVCYVSGRATWTSKNNAPTTESLKMTGFPHAPKREFETINLGLYHGLGLPTGRMELKPHLFADGSMVLFTTESAGNWLEYPTQHVNNAASFAFSGWFIVDDI